MNHIDKLENIDIESLDAFEITVYNDYIRFMSKTKALQAIIDKVDGDYSQLSDTLSEIAQEQDNE